MKKINTVEEYIETHEKFKTGLLILRELLISTALNETLKWSMPTYTVNGKNVISIGAFKNHFCLWFHNGVFLKDKEQKLTAQEKTKGMRQMRFEKAADINKSLVLSYIKEAIENQKLGRELKPVRATKKTVLVSDLLVTAFKEDTRFKESFNVLTLGKQREYCEYITQAKREATKLSRLEKIKPMIFNGMGLNDKYKK